MSTFVKSNTQNILIMIVVSSSEFRDKQRMYLDKVDKGEEVIVQRGKDRAYAITPVEEYDDWIPSPEEKAKIDKGIQQIKNGETITVKNIDEFLGLI